LLFPVTLKGICQFKYRVKMAKAEPGPMSVTGKLGKEVYVKTRHGHHVRKASSKPLSENRLATLGRHNSRTKFLNKLASEINQIVKHYFLDYKYREFYQDLLTKFRKEPLDNRFFLLRQLLDLDLNPLNPYVRRQRPGKVEVNCVEDKFVVSIIAAAPRHPIDDLNSYFFEVVFITWSKEDRFPDHSIQFSRWMPFDGSYALFDFEFPKPDDTVYWLLLVSHQRGRNKEVINPKLDRSIVIKGAGSLDPADGNILSERLEKLKIGTTKPPVEDVKRVEPKVISKEPIQ
jgi:hypothetical protein